MNTRLCLWRFIIRAALVTISLFLHYIEPTASYFYKQDISLHSHVLKCLLHSLSGGKHKKFTPLRQYDVTGLIYAKTFSPIVISGIKNPSLPVDFSSISYILLNVISDNARQRVPGTLSKNYEKLESYQHFNHYALNAPPFP